MLITGDTINLSSLIWTNDAGAAHRDRSVFLIWDDES